MVDYSKFDNINSDDELDEKKEEELAQKLLKEAKLKYQNENQNHNQNEKPKPKIKTKKNPLNNRYIFEYNNIKIYEWEQNLNDIIIYINLPYNNIKKKDLNIIITNKHIKINLINSLQSYIDEDTYKEINVSDSLWYIEDNILIIQLAKMYKGDLWEYPLISKLLTENNKDELIIDEATKLEIKKQLMLERFQEEVC